MRRLYFLLLPLAVACTPTGKSGLPLDASLSELSDDDWSEMCSWLASVSPAAEEETECDGYTVTTYPVELDTCIDTYSLAYGSCSASVEQLEACTQAILDDPCTGLDDPNCTPLLLCALSG